METKNMKPFKINRNSWHYNLNKHFFNENSFWMERTWEPRHANFCSYWRATVFRLLFATALIVIISIALSMLAYAFYAHTGQTLLTIGGTILILAVVIGVPVMLVTGVERIKNSESAKNSIVLQRIRNHKSKICPSVEYHK
jgi:hypothetical protein